MSGVGNVEIHKEDNKETNSRSVPCSGILQRSKQKTRQIKEECQRFAELTPVEVDQRLETFQFSLDGDVSLCFGDKDISSYHICFL